MSTIRMERLGSLFTKCMIPALTTWYQGYYDIWLGGQYFKKVDELHATYGVSTKPLDNSTRLNSSLQGPIVRVNPHELHVNDPEFIEILFTGPGKRRDKDRWVGRAANGENGCELFHFESTI